MTLELSDLPFQLTPKTNIDLDGSVIIHNGDFQLINDNNIIDVTGRVMFKWFPGHGVAFEGEVKNNLPFDLINFNLVIDNQDLGSCFLTNVSGSQSSVKGVFNGKCITGQKSVPVTSIEFEICNLRDFNGRNVQISEIGFANNLLLLENENYKIQLFKHIDFVSKYKDLEWNGLYQTLYSGRLETKRNSENLTFSGTEEIFSCLFLFLTFINGRRCAPIFRKGIFEDQEIWADYSPYHVDKYKTVTSWPPQVQITEVENLWGNFHDLYKDGDQKDFLEVAIHTYVRANGDVALPFEGIAMIANTLELLFNYLIVEKKKIIAGKDIENLQASNKIRLLLSQVGISNDVPEALNEIRSFQADFKEFSQMDAPEFFTQIRNTIVHGQLDKRRKLSKIPSLVMQQVLNMSIWYVEVVLLYILDYKGNYRNRVLNAKWRGDDEQTMPWR